MHRCLMKDVSQIASRVHAWHSGKKMNMSYLRSYIVVYSFMRWPIPWRSYGLGDTLDSMLSSSVPYYYDSRAKRYSADVIYFLNFIYVWMFLVVTFYELPLVQIPFIAIFPLIKLCFRLLSHVLTYSRACTTNCSRVAYNVNANANEMVIIVMYMIYIFLLKQKHNMISKNDKI